MALGEESREVGNRGFAGEIDGRPGKFSGDCGRNRGFGSGAEQNDVGVGVQDDAVESFRETIGGPAFGGTVGGAGAYRDAQGVGA